MRSATKQKTNKQLYDETLTRLYEEQNNTNIWRERALIAEQYVKQLEAKNVEYLNGFVRIQTELNETKQKLPSGAVLTHIENLLSINESYRRILVGDSVGIRSFLRLVWLTIFKRYR